MIEKRYILDRKTFEIKEAYIEPEHEWSKMKVGADEWCKIYNDMNPVTKERTGGFYRECDVFSSVEEGKEGLRAHIKNVIDRNRQHIEKLEERNNELTNILMIV